MKTADFQTDSDGLRKEGEFIASFFPVLKEKSLFLDISGKILRKEYRIAIMYEGRELETFVFKSLDKIHYSEYWDECCDAEMLCKNKKMLQMYLQCCAREKNFTEYYQVGHTGLLSDSPIIFAYGNNAVIAREKFLFVCLPSLPVFEIKKEIADSLLLGYAQKLIALEPGITDLLFIVRAACVIKPIFKLQNYLVDFIVGILGVSGTQKSTYAKLFFVENMEQLLTFSFSNRKLLMERLEKYSGHAIVVDDYHPMAKKYDKEKQQGILDALARKADSGDGAIGVMTGEYLEGPFSLQDRVVPICTSKKASDNSEFSKSLLLLANEKYKLTALMYLFAQKAYVNLEDMSDKLNELISTSGNSIAPYRIVRFLSILGYTWELFKSSFPEAEKWTADQQISRSMQRLLSERTKRMDVIRRLEYEADMTREVYCMICNGVYRETEVTDTMFYKGYYLQEKKIYITRLALKNEMYKFLRVPVDVDEVVSHLRETGVLCEDNSTARTKKLNQKRFYVIDRDRLRAYGQRQDT